MNTKKLLGFLVACVCAFGTFTLHAQEFSFEDIDALLEGNVLTDASNRYSSVILSFFPERATRMGYASANAKLDERSPRNTAQALAALRGVQDLANTVKAQKLSPAKQVDLEMLKNALAADIFVLEQNPVVTNPLYYTQAIDAIYDVLLLPYPTEEKRREDLIARVDALPQVAQSARENLAQPPTFLSQQAMEKAYYAYLSFEEIAVAMLEGVEDEFEIQKIKQQGRDAKKALRDMFDLFKQLSQDKNLQDFRLGEKMYARVLKNRYQVDEPTAKLIKKLEKNFADTQKALAEQLTPFQMEAAEAEEEVTVIDGLNDQPTVEEVEEKKPAKKKKQAYVPPTAQSFYVVAKRAVSATEQEDPVEALEKDANQLANFFAQKGALPAGPVNFSVKPMPQFYTYSKAYLFQPFYGEQVTEAADFFLRLPAGNQLAKEEQLKRDFNTPVRKLMLSGELIPGRYYQALSSKNLSDIRRFYPSASLANGWSTYAQHQAKEQGYILTDEELLFLTWADYRRAIMALLDAKLHTQAFSYTDAINFLVQENAFEQKEAEEMLKQLAAEPGKSVSYLAGLEALETEHAKYHKKYGKNFNEAFFNEQLLKVGNVPPNLLKPELERLYKGIK